MKYYPSFVFAILMIVGCGGGGDTVIQESSSPLAPNIQASTLYVTKSVNQTNRSIVENSGGSISSCELNDTILNGFTLNNDCTISGSSNVEQNRSFTITAKNAYGSDSKEFIFSVVPTTTATLSGKITFDLVPATSSGLDYNNITQEALRGVKVDIIDDSGVSIGTTTTDANGNYSLNVTGGAVKVRVYAQLYKAPNIGQSSWDFQVKDNTSGEVLYSLDGSFAPMGTSGVQTRNLNASSGWGGSSYTSERAAAPFAILDVIYDAITKIETAQVDAVFSPLNIFWSKDNISSSVSNANVSEGRIITSHYNGVSLYILGRENSDTDEYDRVIIGHEWGHYYEDKFSRSDSIGYSHGYGDSLDIRVAFGEGFGTAIGAIISDTPNYIDTYNSGQKSAGYVNLENGGSRNNAGWFNEISVADILYDIYDSNNDTGDTLSLGFTPMHNLLIGKEKNTTAFTSIFTFIKGLKDENSGASTAIDAITSNESIASITDIYGSNRQTRTQNANPLYATVPVNGSVIINPDYSADSDVTSNRLGTYNFAKFTLTQNGNYTINVSSSSNLSQLGFALFEGASKADILNGTSTANNIALNAGTYRMWIQDTNRISSATITVALTKN